MDSLIEKIKDYAMGENRKYKEASEDYYVELQLWYRPTLLCGG